MPENNRSVRGSGMVVVLSMLLAAAQGMPSIYVSRINPRDCMTHPLQGPYDYITNTAKAAVRDPDITFVLSSVDGGDAVVDELCPGEFYETTVAFANNRYALLTSSLHNSHFRDAPDRLGINKYCPNRTYYDPVTRKGTLDETPAPKKSWTTSLFVPCNAAGKIRLKVTSASGNVVQSTMGQLLWNGVTLKVNPKCVAKRCEEGRVG